MAAIPPGAAEVLCREVLEEARRQAATLVDEARGEADRLRAAAEAEADRERRERMEEARAEAARRSATILATVPIEVARLRAAGVEALLQALHDQARERLVRGDGFDPARARVALAAEALARMDGNAFLLRVGDGDAVDLAEVRRQAGRGDLALSVVPDPEVRDGGLVVQDPEGRQVWDARLAVRLGRLWPELRRRIVARQAGGP